MPSFDEKVAIVTGAAGYLGSDVARAFAADGARVALAELDAKDIESVRSKLPAGAETAPFASDAAWCVTAAALPGYGRS